MKTKLILAILIIALVGCCNVVSAVNIDVTSGTIQDLGEVEYRDYDNKYFNGDVEVTFLFSTLAVEFISIERHYDSFENVTRYKFTSNEIEPEWWMNFTDLSSFSYMLDETVNTTSNKHIIAIGEVFVDYSELEIPMSPWEENLTILNETYFEMMGYYDLLSTNYTHFYNLYNATKENFNAKVEELATLNIAIATLQQERDDAIGEHDSLNASLQENMTKYNNTYNLLIDAGKNVSYYRMFYDGMISYNKDGFWFNNVYYLTIDETADVIQGLKNDLGIAPLYTILAITLTALILFFLFRVFTAKKNPTAIEIESNYNYMPESRKIDSWVNKFKTNVFGKKDDTPAEKPVVPIIPVKEELIKPIETKEEKPDVVVPTMKEDIISAVKNEMEGMITRIVADAITASEKKGKPA